MKLPKSIVLTALIKLNMAVTGSQRPEAAGHLTLRLSMPDGAQPWRDGSDPGGQLGTRLLQKEALRGMGPPPSSASCRPAGPGGRGQLRARIQSPTRCRLCPAGSGEVCVLWHLICGGGGVEGGAQKPPELGGSRSGKLKASVNLFLTKRDTDHPFCKKHSVGFSPWLGQRTQPGRLGSSRRSAIWDSRDLERAT